MVIGDMVAITTIRTSLWRAILATWEVEIAHETTVLRDLEMSVQLDQERCIMDKVVLAGEMLIFLVQQGV
jgi:hypothetical protein